MYSSLCFTILTTGTLTRQSWYGEPRIQTVSDTSPPQCRVLPPVIMQLRGQSFAISLFLPVLLATFITLTSGQLTLEEIARRYTVRTPGGGIHIPILPWGRTKVERNLKRAPVSTVGIGDYHDVYVFTFFENIIHLESLEGCIRPS